MDKLGLDQNGIEVGLFMIKAVLPSQWSSYLAFNPCLDAVGWGTTLFALILPLLLLWAFKRYRKMQYENRRPFRFLDLPQELRDMVYENLLEDPLYPPPPLCVKQTSSVWRIPGRRSSSTSQQELHKSNWIFLANKQVYREYMDMLCKKMTFRLTVTPQNYNPEPSLTSPSAPTSTPEDSRIWRISPDTLKNLRTGSLKLITTSAMLGVADPRNMTSSEWTLARQIREELKYLANVTSLTLNAKAIGDPLWNPLWIWYHASQSFKTMGTEQSDTVPIGPQLNKISFSLDTWSPGENYIQRDPQNKNQWTWYCMQDHPVGLDIGPEMTVREFCGKLYQECRECRAELESETDE